MAETAPFPGGYRYTVPFGLAKRVCVVSFGLGLAFGCRLVLGFVRLKCLSVGTPRLSCLAGPWRVARWRLLVGGHVSRVDLSVACWFLRHLLLRVLRPYK